MDLPHETIALGFADQEIQLPLFFAGDSLNVEPILFQQVVLGHPESPLKRLFIDTFGMVLVYSWYIQI